MADLEYYRSLARALVAGKKLILPGGVLARSGRRVAALRDLGAERPFLLASGRGTGPQPTLEEAESFTLDITAPRIIQEIRATDRALSVLPSAAVDALDAYDPDHEAIVLGGPFTTSAEIAGRRVIGRRPPGWTFLEDKVIVDELWDTAGVTRVQSVIVPATAAALRDAATRFDQGSGSVWAGDAKEGYNGAGEYVRWIRRPDDIAEAETFFAEHCDRVRVMPFLEGIPASIHGFIHGGRIAVFRPVEQLTLRTPTNRFHYSGTATYWDPDPAGREEMRNVARHVGAELSRRVDYRGGFTVDGVLTAEGFRPTELNARFGGGMPRVTNTLGLPLDLIQTIAVEDPLAELHVNDLEEIVVTHADANRAGDCFSLIPESKEETETHDIIDGGDVFAFAPDGVEPTGTMSIGPSGLGGLVNYQPDPGKVPTGESFAPVAVRAFAFSDDKFETRLGSLEAARSVR